MNIVMKKHFMAPPVYANDKRGIVLVSVLLVSAIGLAISIYLLLLAVAAAQSTARAEQSTKARAYADACAEYALNQLRLSPLYTGPTTLSFPNGSCEVPSVLGTGTFDRTVRAQGLVGDTIRKVEILVSITTPLLTVSSWQEVADFSSP